ncbi:Regulator of ribonuclease activity B [Klenkia marina]|uniref:Regulator of ribonuclease activity B n=1 Tax=Klenkia marina TaxID=1960309 RepID=A0A1G4X9C8_9ACTN|nr:ribonuclease E inhibitor RraB [Klenkia marina]SCX37816.1 Regulator of ribonuclease activity B [Klenkia marina]
MTSDMAAQHEANVALVAQRVELGDAPHVPRPLDHLVVVPRRHAAAVQTDLVALGFRVDGVGRGLRRVRIEFSRIDAADVDTADASSQQIFDVVDRHGGEYDGWSGYLAADPADAPEA